MNVSCVYMCVCTFCQGQIQIMYLNFFLLPSMVEANILLGVWADNIIPGGIMSLAIIIIYYSSCL